MAISGPPQPLDESASCDLASRIIIPTLLEGSSAEWRWLANGGSRVDEADLFEHLSLRGARYERRGNQRATSPTRRVNQLRPHLTHRHPDLAGGISVFSDVTNSQTPTMVSCKRNLSRLTSKIPQLLLATVGMTIVSFPPRNDRKAA